MHLTVLSSLSLFARNDAAQYWLDRAEERPAVVRFDHMATTDKSMELQRTLTTATGAVEQERIIMEGNCLSCAIHAAAQEYLEDIAGLFPEIFLVLPAGVSVTTAIKISTDLADLDLASAITAVSQQELEDDLWSAETLHTRGVSGGCADERTPGEFTVAELTYADTAILTSHPFACESDENRAHDLLRQIAPHLAVMDALSGAGDCGCHSLQDAQARATPGHLGLPSCAMTAQQSREEPGISTVLVQADALVDSVRLAEVLPKMVEGAVRVRGEVWLDSHADDRVAVEGIGPTVWLQTHGAWDSAGPATRIAVTGEDMDARELQDLLDSCLMTGGDIAEHLLRDGYLSKEG